jgi:hypothetical protein
MTDTDDDDDDDDDDDYEGAVARGLEQLRKLGIEEQLWEVSRKEIAQEVANYKLVDPENTSSSHLQRLASSLSVQSL